MSTEQFPASLIAGDVRLLIGVGVVTKTASRALAGPKEHTRAIAFELEPPPGGSREVYFARELRRVAPSTSPNISAISLVDPEHLSERPPEAMAVIREYRRVLSAQRNSGSRTAAAGPRLGRLRRKAYANLQEWSAVTEACCALQPLAQPLVCAVRMFDLEGSPILTLVDDCTDRMVLAISDLGGIEWSPEARGGYKPRWYDSLVRI